LPGLFRFLSRDYFRTAGAELKINSQHQMAFIMGLFFIYDQAALKLKQDESPFNFFLVDCQQE
jgi:hypothetical protein